VRTVIDHWEIKRGTVDWGYNFAVTTWIVTGIVLAMWLAILTLVSA
jgi:hypothetical protein